MLLNKAWLAFQTSLIGDHFLCLGNVTRTFTEENNKIINVFVGFLYFL